jgi:hypothetical protein
MQSANLPKGNAPLKVKNTGWYSLASTMLCAYARIHHYPKFVHEQAKDICL